MQCLAALSNLPGAIQCCEELLGIDPDDDVIIITLAEYYLIARDIQKAERVMENRKQFMIEKYSDFLIWYFDLIKLYLKNDLNALKHHIDNELIQSTEGNIQRIKNWNFIDLRKGFKKDNASPLKSLFFTSIDFLDGIIDVSALNKIKSENGDTP